MLSNEAGLRIFLHFAPPSGAMEERRRALEERLREVEQQLDELRREQRSLKAKLLRLGVTPPPRLPGPRAQGQPGPPGPPDPAGSPGPPGSRENSDDESEPGSASSSDTDSDYHEDDEDDDEEKAPPIEELTPEERKALSEEPIPDGYNLDYATLDLLTEAVIKQLDPVKDELRFDTKQYVITLLNAVQRGRARRPLDKGFIFPDETERLVCGGATQAGKTMFVVVGIVVAYAARIPCVVRRLGATARRRHTTARARAR